MAAFDGAAVTVPALFIVGDRDMLDAVFQQAIAKQSTLVPKLRPAMMLAGCGHWTQQERAPEVSAANRLPSAVVGSRLSLCDRPARRGTSRRSLVVMRRCPATSEPSGNWLRQFAQSFQKNHMNDQPENLTRLNEVSR
jgi:hypothetical protein